MTTTRDQTNPFRPAVDLTRERVWVQGTSLCRSRDRLWRPAHLDELQTRLRNAVAWEAGDLAARWDSVLSGAEDAVVRLAAEALAVHFLIASDIRADTKRLQIASTLARIADPPPLPPAVDLAFEHGPTPTGVAFKRRRLSQLAFIVRATSTWRTRRASDRRADLDDPWTFRSWLDTVPVEGAQAQRHALLHLVHPDTFEPIASAEAKRRIVETLGTEEERNLDTDEALLAIRVRLTPVHGVGFSFGAPPLRDRWLS